MPKLTDEEREELVRRLQRENDLAEALKFAASAALYKKDPAPEQRTETQTRQEAPKKP